MIGIGEGPAAADRHETRVAVFREDHTQQPFNSHLPNFLHDAPALRLSVRRPSSEKPKLEVFLQGKFETCPVGVVEFILGSLKLTA